MKILSEKTNKEYATVEECLEAEKAYDEEQLAVKAKEEALANERKSAAEEVEKARRAMIEASQKYRETLAQFCDKYGVYHRSYRFNDKNAKDLWDDFFNFWF